MRPDTIILVHGEKSGMKRLKEELDREIRRNWPVAHRPHVAMPDNQTVCKLRFPKAITAECMGSLGEDMMGQLVQLEKQEGLGLGQGPGGREDMTIPRKAVLVSENFVSRIVAVDELSTYTSCRRGRVVQKIVIPVPAGLLGGSAATQGWERGTLLRALTSFLEEMFDAVVFESASGGFAGTGIASLGGPPAVPTPIAAQSDVGPAALIVQGVVRVCEEFYTGQPGSSSSSAGALPAALLVVWEASPASDCVADCAVGAVLQALSVSNLLQLSLKGSSLMAEAGRTGGLYKGSKKRAHAHPPKEEAGAGAEGSFAGGMGGMAVAPPGKEDSAEARINEIIRKMQAGAVDPSRAIAQSSVIFSLPAGHLDAGGMDALEANRTRLANLRQQLLAADGDVFESISITADGLKLLFTGAARKVG